MERTELIRRRAKFLPGGGFYVWLILMTGAVIMTQALRSPVSTVLFWFAVMMLPASLAYVFTGFFMIHVYVSADGTRTEKGTPVTYEVSVINESPLCFPAVEASIIVPRQDGVRCEAQHMVLCLFPLGTSELSHSVTFPFRGTYQIGMDCFYITDLFRMFRIRQDVELFHTVLVFPRRLTLDDPTRQSVSDLPSEVSRRRKGGDPTEAGDVRAYYPGDSLKSIHWKLSGKAQDLLVREYETADDKRVYLLVDFSAHREDPLPEKPVTEAPKRKKKHAVRLRVGDGKDRLRRQAERMAARRARMLGTETDAAAQAPRASVKPEYRADFDEYCADGTCEVAVSALLRELRRGNRCTLIWYDGRGAEGQRIRSMDVTGPEDLESVWVEFTTTPVAGCEDGVGKLVLRLNDAVNATVRVVSANLDEQTLSTVESIPTLLGGAGCTAELLLFNPEERYDSVVARREAVSSVRGRLLRQSVTLREMHALPIGDGREIMTEEITL